MTSSFETSVPLVRRSLLHNPTEPMFQDVAFCRSSATYYYVVPIRLDGEASGLVLTCGCRVHGHDLSHPVANDFLKPDG